MAGYGQYSQLGSWGKRNPLPMQVVSDEKPKRTRTVFPTDEIPHLWAHQTQSQARNPQGNLFFEGPIIYSYRHSFPMATWAGQGRGKTARRAVLFYTGKYSVTTSRHQSAARNAIPAGVEVFEVPRLDCTCMENHRVNLKDYQRRIADESVKAQHARSMRFYTYRREMAHGLAAEADRYCQFFHLRLPKLPAVYMADMEKRAQLQQWDAQQLAELPESERL